MFVIDDGVARGDPEDDDNPLPDLPNATTTPGNVSYGTVSTLQGVFIHPPLGEKLTIPSPPPSFIGPELCSTTLRFV